MSKKLIAGVIVSSFILCLLYARFIETNKLVKVDYIVENKELSNDFDSLKIIQISDIHFGRITSDKKISKLVNKVNEENPDIIVITGDLIDKNTDNNEELNNKLLNFLNSFESKLGNYIVSGNHDEVHKEFYEIVSNSNFILLEDEYVNIYNGSMDKIIITGHKNCSYNSINNIEFLEGDVDSFIISLMHEPDCASKVSTLYSPDVILSGHSHAGQIRFPIIGSVITPPLAKNYIYGKYDVNDSDLYVSRGYGVSTINMRFLDSPSYTVYRLSNR